VEDQRPVLDYVETEITEFCNLNCKGCSDFSNLVKEKNFYEFDSFVKDYNRLAELFSSVKKIRLMGGEPLLNPRLTDYIEVCRHIFPTADIRIVSNGLLIPKLSDEQLKTIQKNNCKFDISNYPPTRKMFGQIKSRLDDFQVEYDLGFPMNYFFRFLLDAPNDEPDRAFRNCIFTHCHMLSNGKLSPCSFAHCIGRYNRTFGLEYPETDCIDIYSEITGEEIINRFSHPHEFCKYCGKGMIPFRWQGGITREKASKEDWLIQNNFLSMKFAPFVQSLLKKPASMLRSFIQRRRT